MENNYQRISESLDSLINKLGSKKVSTFLDEVSTNIMESPRKVASSTVTFVASSIYNISMEDIESGGSRTHSECRMICSHILHRIYGFSISEIGEIYGNAKKGAIHRLIKNMDGFIVDVK